MHTALNETLAALPNDTKVYVSIASAAAKKVKLTRKAWPRVHETKCQILDICFADGAREEVTGVCRKQSADAGQVYDCGRESKFSIPQEQ